MTCKHLGRLSVDRLPILVLLLVVLTTAPAKAQSVRDWIATSGDYDTSTNWFPFNVPDTTSESARFDVGGNNDVTLTSGVTTLVSDLLVGSGNTTFNANGVASAIYETDDDALIVGGDLTLTKAPGLGDVTLNVGDQLQVAGSSTFSVLEGSDVTANGLSVAEGGGSGTINVNGIGSSLGISSTLNVGKSGLGMLNIEAGAQVLVSGVFSSNIGTDPGSAGTVTVTGAGSTWDSGLLTIGNNGQGTLNVEAGGQVNTTNGNIGNRNGAVGMVTVTGSGSTWTSGRIDVGLGSIGAAQGTLTVDAGGQVITNSFFSGQFANSIGTTMVTGAGSIVTTGEMQIGSSGQGILNVEAGGQFFSGRTIIATFSTSVGTDVTVTGTGSTWTNSETLEVGRDGQATLNINNGGLVTVQDSTIIGSQGSVVFGGGRFEFGTIDATSYGRISGTSGELVGDLLGFSGFNALSSIDLSIPNLDTSGVRIFNDGVLFGGGVLPHGLTNTATGELRTLSGEWTRISGSGNTNAGEINNFAGVVEFVQGITNETTGFVGGRGQFIADGGWANEGVMAFSAGPADVLGDVVNSATGQIITTGGAVTTFFDDVVHNGVEIRTADSSSTVFLGAATGAGSFTGTGAVFFEGDLRPGNSPDTVTFGGDVVLGTGAEIFIELSGTTTGEFDRLDVAGNLSLDGDLMVSLLGSFELDMAMEFIIAKVDGALAGEFANFADGDLVGTFGGTDLFIDYEGGDGNDVALFTAGLPGDFDLDEDVDGADFLTWQRGFGTTYNSDDLDDWQGNYGTTPNAIASSTSVPEPSTRVLCCLLGLTGVVHWRR